MTLKLEIKVTYVHGLQPFVIQELAHYPELKVLSMRDQAIAVALPDQLSGLFELRSVSRVYLMTRDRKYNPRYIAQHKSILGAVLDRVLAEQKNAFHSFRLECAGSDSGPVREVIKYIAQTFKLPEAADADLKVHMVKVDGVWEVGAQLTPRPLSVRDYRVQNMPGAMDGSIAYAMNSLAKLEAAQSYLNVFAGSGTLLIEAAREFPHLKKLIGFDHDPDAMRAARENIRRAGYQKRIQLKLADIFDRPDFGQVDVITADLPFGMLISRGEDLSELYRTFIQYSIHALRPGGRLVVYTTEHEKLRRVFDDLALSIKQLLELKINTSANVYLYPKIFVTNTPATP